MADLRPRGVTGGGDRGDGAGAPDRGQLVLVAGFALAVVLVALVLVTNTAIVTENLATREDGVGEGEALAFRASVVDGVGGLVDRENAAEYDTRAALEANVTDGIVALDGLFRETAAQQAASARVNVSSLSYVDGVLVRQTNASRRLESALGTSDWTAAYDTNRTRAFAATVNRSSLESADPDDLSDAFAVVVAENGSTDEWRAYVYERSGNVSVAVRPPDTTDATEVCSVDAATVTVGFTNGTLAGEPCPELDWREGIDSAYDIEFRNGSSARGTYDLTVRGTPATLGLATLELNDGGLSDDPASPYFVPAVYAVEADVRFQTSELEYATTVRVAPGEDDE